MINFNFFRLFDEFNYFNYFKNAIIGRLQVTEHELLKNRESSSQEHLKVCSIFH